MLSNQIMNGAFQGNVRFKANSGPKASDIWNANGKVGIAFGGASFEVRELQRIRLATLTRPSAAYLRWGAAWPARGAVEGWLARRELARARGADAVALQAQVYHDVAIRASRRA